MKKIGALAILILVVSVTAGLIYQVSKTQQGRQKLNLASQQLKQLSDDLKKWLPSCDPQLWDHVYRPGRLKVIEECMEVKGVIRKIRVAKDGDYHIQLELDPSYSHLLNEKNIKKQDGNLVLEPICQKPVKQESAKEACAGFNKFMHIPPVGTRVKVAGSYVLDVPHGWMEIHPVTSIIEIQ